MSAHLECTRECVLPIFYLFYPSAFNDLIPNIGERNYLEHKENYLAQLSQKAPPFLAYIEFYNVDFSTVPGNSEESGPDITVSGRCSGSLISTQHVLT